MARPDDGFDVVGARSALYPDTRHVLGFNPGETGFRIVLTAGVADVIDEHFGDDMTRFLADHDATNDDIARWIAHPGGPRVLDAFSDALELPPGALDVSWRLAGSGRQPVVGIRAARAGRQRSATPRRPAESCARCSPSGPGVCAELVLLRWSGVSGMTLSVVLYTILILLTGGERIVELVVSTRNAAWAFARGGLEFGRRHFGPMVALSHGTAAGLPARDLPGRPPVHSVAGLAHAGDRAR